MIRSLVVSPKSEVSSTEIDEDTPDALSNLRRNLSEEKLEQALAEGCFLWLDIISPEAQEIRWLENWLELSPTVVGDLMREDRRPTLLVYPQYLFLSLFQPHSQSKKLVSKEIHCIIGENYFITVRKLCPRFAKSCLLESRCGLFSLSHGSACH